MFVSTVQLLFSSRKTRISTVRDAEPQNTMAYLSLDCMKSTVASMVFSPNIQLFTREAFVGLNNLLVQSQNHVLRS